MINAAIVLAPVYGDREDPIEGVTSGLIAEALVPGEQTSVELADSLEDAARRAAAQARPGDTVMTIGSGTVTQAASSILELLGHADG